MGLIYCPECGTQVSEHAQQCIKCAYPINKRQINNMGHNLVQSSIHNATQSNNININNTIIWILAFAPIIGTFLQGFVFGFITSYTNSYYNYNKFWWVTLALNVLLCYLDEKKLEQAGVDTEKIGSYWLIPVYLYKRAEVLNQSQAYFWVWISTFILSFYL